MVATPSILVSQSDLNTVAEGGAADIFVSQADSVTVFNIPTEEIHVTQADESAVIDVGADIQISQLDIIAIFTGRVDDPSVRAWTFTLDGHDFYVLRLGTEETLIYDLLTEQWHVWSTGEELYWSLFTGVNWFGGNTFSDFFGSNVIVGSDANGSLFFLDPNKPSDDAAVTGRDPVPFRRRVTSQLAIRGYDRARVYEVQLLGSVSQFDLGADNLVHLLYSDDRGDNYISAGTVTTSPRDYDIRATWRSLGSFSSPGRLFQVEDFGALKRIDSLTVNTDLQQG